MDCDTPEPAPPVVVLADLCARRAWDDDVDDASRQLLEWAADTMRALMLVNGRLAIRSEKLEAALHGGDA